MSLFRFLESWAEGLLRIGLGIGLAWIGGVEGAGYGLFLDVVGVIFIAAGVAEIWSVEAAVHQLNRETPTVSDIHPALMSWDIPVFYATTEGQTRRIAERLVALFRDRGFTSRAIDVASPDANYVDWRRARAALVGASLHAHRHQRSARTFVDEHAPELNVRPSVFFSVSLAAASDSAEERKAATRIACEFAEAAEWHPDEIVCLAGRLAYTRYGSLTRFIMKRIARRHGNQTDTSRDYEFTNWDAVARMADGVMRRIGAERAHTAA
jgi:menaquinone-dependent protoporphyrinogen oxidase